MSDWYSAFLSDPNLLNMALSAPQQFSQQMAASGIPAPTTPTVSAPMGPTFEQMNGVDPMNAMAAGAPQEVPSLGESLSPTPTPRTPNPYAGLAGAVRPQPPQAQRVSTPSAPRPTGQIKQGELMQMLASLGLLGGQPQPEPYKLPSTLGAALGGGR